ncbi:MAG: hypothetical protein QOJ79_1914 [Actinomycetota bacterium]|nr:hypothetical protein [Actinomycetota bacterium]
MAELRDLVEQHYDGMRDGDIDESLGVFTPDCVTVMPGAGTLTLDELRPFLEGFKTAVPDAHMDVRHMYELSGTCIVEGVFRGTHSGPMRTPQGELPPTGNEIAVEYADVFVARDGLIGEHRIYYDTVQMMAQMGG